MYSLCRAVMGLMLGFWLAATAAALGRAADPADALLVTAAS